MIDFTTFYFLVGGLLAIAVGLEFWARQDDFLKITGMTLLTLGLWPILLCITYIIIWNRRKQNVLNNRL